MAFHLSILLILAGLTGIHSVTTVSKVSVKAGDSISIPCFYEKRYLNNVKYLCKGYYWNSCTYATTTSQPQSSGKYSISDNKTQGVFTVDIKQLTTTDTYFWCSVQINRGADDGTFFELSVTSGTPSLYVNRQKITGFDGGNITISCNYSTSGENSWCKLGGNCVTGPSGSIDGVRVTIDERFPSFFTVTMSGLRLESSGWYWCAKGGFQMPVHVTVTDKPTTTTLITVVDTVEDGTHSASFDLMSLIIPLSLLILIVVVALLVWLMLRRKHTKAQTSGRTVADEEVTYSDIKHKKKPSAQRSVAKSDEDVTYSSVVIVKQQTPKWKAESEAEDITYSTLANHQQNQHPKI